MLRVVAMTEGTDGFLKTTLGEIAVVHMLVKDDTLRASICAGRASGKSPNSRYKFDIDVIPVIDGVTGFSVREVLLPSLSINMLLDVAEK